MKVFRLLIKEWQTALVVLVLLAVQAACQLALPDYMSDMVDKGIQQSGVTSPVAERLTNEGFSDIQLLLTDQEAERFRAAYRRDGESWALVLSDSKEKEELGKIISLPMTALFYAKQQGGDAALGMLRLGASGAQSKENILKMMRSDIEIPEAMLSQAAVQFVLAEYKSLGLDVNAMQTSYLWRTGGVMLLVTLLMGIAAAAMGFFASRASARIGRDLRSQVYGKVIGFSKAEVDGFSTASLITRTGNDIRQVEQAAAMTLRMVFYAPMLAFIGIWRVATLQSGLSWIVVIAVLSAATVVGTLAGRAVPRFRVVQDKVDRQNLVTREILTGLPVIRAFTRERFEEERFNASSRDLIAVIRYIARTFTLMMPIMMLLMNGVILAILWFGAKRIDAGSLQVGSLMAMVMYTMYIVMGFMMLSMSAIMLPRANVSIQRIMEVLAAKSSVSDPEKPLSLPSPKGEIVFQNVSFRYPDAGEDMLSHVSFVARPGQTTAIIGGTGSGKSTLINLIPRLFDVTQGAILIDGVDIRELGLRDLRALIGYVPQQGVLFSGTIESNIAYADESLSVESVEAAAKTAQAEAFILKKEGGYQSEVARGGSNVSGGQKQRLSIARALAKRPAILLFDDSFSALDYSTDLRLRQALKKDHPEATVLIVAQRIATVLKADQIIVLEEGKVMGTGKHEELMASCPAYRAIATSQLSDEELGGVAL